MNTVSFWLALVLTWVGSLLMCAALKHAYCTHEESLATTAEHAARHSMSYSTGETLSRGSVAGKCAR